MKSSLWYFAGNPEKLIFTKTGKPGKPRPRAPTAEAAIAEYPTPLQLKTARAFPLWFALCRTPFEGPRIPVKTTNYLQKGSVENASFWPTGFNPYPFLYYRYKEKKLWGRSRQK